MSFALKIHPVSDYNVSYFPLLGGSVTFHQKELTLRAPLEKDLQMLHQMIFSDRRLMETFVSPVEKLPETARRVEEIGKKIAAGSRWHGMVAIDRYGLVVGYLDLEQKGQEVHFKVAVSFPEQGKKVGKKISLMMLHYAAEMNKQLTTPCTSLVGTLVDFCPLAARHLFTSPPFQVTENEETRQTIVRVAIATFTSPSE